MAEAAGSTRHQYGLLLVGTLSYTCLTFVWFSLPTYLSTLINDIGLTGLEAGVLAGAVPLTYIPLALFSGFAVDRIGPMWSLVAGTLIFGTAQTVRSFAHSFPTLLALTLLIGVGAMAVTFGLPKLVSVLFPPTQTGIPSSIYLVGSSAGTAAAFGIGRPLLGPALGGWRPLFFWSGVISVAYGVILIGTTQITDGLHNDSKEDSQFDLDSLRDDLRQILTHSQLRLVVVVGTMYLLIIHGMQGWLPTILETRGFDSALAGQTTSLLVVANVGGILLIPSIADRVNARRRAIIVSGAVAFAGLIALLLNDRGAVVLGGVVATGFGIGGLSPLIRAIPPKLEGIGAKRTGIAVGFVFAVGEAGGFLGPVVVGALHDLTGSFTPGILTLASGAAVVVLTGVRLERV